ncbi:hypothetical protein [Nonomuraea diastatica]|uniref:ABM domain-containing protein n=1 Tax=Nonomuraea diastatica TaxID=1848329 RepID=A0A4R4WSB1_9ACTN|nr:hypothetical protein [Nonomuraea diastatica]TDD20456.1 hypothetical protein E1294_17755 [Nonomuraea diastatica]
MSSSPALPLPSIMRPGSGTLLIDSAYAGDRHRQHVMAQAIVDEWTSIGWPEGSLSLRCHLSTDGETVLTYAEWSSDEAQRAYASRHLRSSTPRPSV